MGCRKVRVYRKASKVLEKVPGKVGPGEGSGSGEKIPSKVSASGGRFLGFERIFFVSNSLRSLLYQLSLFYLCAR